MMHNIFISYANQDVEIAHAVCGALEFNKYACWIAFRDIEPEKEWVEVVSGAIAASSLFIVLVSADANLSQTLIQEVALASNLNTPILAIRTDKCSLDPTLTYCLDTARTVDVTRRPLQKHLERIVELTRDTLAPKKYLKMVFRAGFISAILAFILLTPVGSYLYLIDKSDQVLDPRIFPICGILLGFVFGFSVAFSIRPLIYGFRNPQMVRTILGFIAGCTLIAMVIYVTTEELIPEEKVEPWMILTVVALFIYLCSIPLFLAIRSALPGFNWKYVAFFCLAMVFINLLWLLSSGVAFAAVDSLTKPGDFDIYDNLLAIIYIMYLIGSFASFQVSLPVLLIRRMQIKRISFPKSRRLLRHRLVYEMMKNTLGKRKQITRGKADERT